MLCFKTEYVRLHSVIQTSLIIHEMNAFIFFVFLAANE